MARGEFAKLIKQLEMLLFLRKQSVSSGMAHGDMGGRVQPSIGNHYSAENQERFFMCNSIKRTIGAVLTGAAALLFGAGQIKADISPGTCTAGSNGSDAVPQSSSAGPFAVGQLMGYRVLLTNPTLDQFQQPGCTISNAFVNLRMPSGEVIPILTNIVLLPGEQIICPGGAQCLSTSRTGLVGAQLFYTNTITASQVTNVNLTVPQCPPASGTNQAILAFTLGGAVVFNNANPGIFGTATYNRCSTIPVNL